MRIVMTLIKNRELATCDPRAQRHRGHPE